MVDSLAQAAAQPEAGLNAWHAVAALAALVSLILGVSGWLTIRAVNQFDVRTASIEQATKKAADALEALKDQLPERFNKAHARISEVEKDVVRLETRLNVHLGGGTSGC